MTKKCTNCGNIDAKKFISLGDIHYCDVCIDTFGKDPPKVSKIFTNNVLLPNDIKDKMDECIVGQNSPKLILSTLLFKHSLRKNNPSLQIEKSNCILIGNSGSGKTLIAKTASKIIDVPFHIVDSTTITESGYIGEDASNILLGLMEASNWDVKKAEYGIIFLDELDKKARKTDDYTGKDVSGAGAQHSLLKIIEGTKIKLIRKKHDETVILDTSNIMFIGAGSFEGMNNIVDYRNFTNIFEFINNQSDINQEKKTLPEDLISYGLIPELVGRLGSIIDLKDLDENDILNILNLKNSVIKEYIKIFKMYDIQLVFSKELLQNYAAKAILQKTGARGLRTVVDDSLVELIFSLSRLKEENVSKILLKKDFLMNKNSIKIEYRED